MKIFVAGATGQTGKHIVRQLIERNVPVKALVRDTEAAKAILPPTTELIVGDVLKPTTFEDHLADCNVLICATGASPSLDPTGPYQVDYQGTKNLVNAAQAKNLEHFILVSSLCVSKFFHPLNLFWLILYWKKQAESYIQSSGIPYTIVRPGGLKNESNSEPIVMSGADTLFDGSIPRPKVAQVCVEAIFQPEAKSKIVEIVTNSEAESKTWEKLFSQVP
ncbi:SDR family oxidoreductase [Pleurocapsa sp. PCC 7319]|uniref:SDR family oxidoreductase n=1 Tax=Pleurocapsa sp. PCC 7319 TaxID=118161 RepID=UPI00034C005D|nr:SDR family oxidoreductase [Pleurocapsa sp. PCC 7319]